METCNGILKGKDKQIWAEVKNSVCEDAWLSGQLLAANPPPKFMSLLTEYSELIDSGIFSLVDEFSEQLLSCGASFQFEGRYEEHPISDFYLDGEILSVKLEPAKNERHGVGLAGGTAGGGAGGSGPTFCSSR